MGLAQLTTLLLSLQVCYYSLTVIMTGTTIISFIRNQGLIHVPRSVRLYTRIYILKQFGADDALITPSMLLFGCLFPSHKLYRKNVWALRMVETYGALVLYNTTWRRSAREVEKQMWLISLVGPIIIQLFKLSVLAFYCRFLPCKPYRLWIYATMLVSVVFGTAIALASYFQYYPFYKAEPPPAGTKPPRLTIFALLIMVGAFNLLTDIVLVLLPAPVVMRLHVSRKKKLGLMLLFSLGVVGTVVTGARLWQTVRMLQLERHARWSEYQAQRLILAFLGGIEMAIIPLCTNMPALTAFWHARGRRSRSRRRPARAVAAQNKPPGPPGTWRCIATAIRAHEWAAAAAARFVRVAAPHRRQRNSDDAACDGQLEGHGNTVGDCGVGDGN